MRDLLSWNLSLGRWGGVQVRLHVFFLLFIVVALHFGSAANDQLFWETCAVLGILLASVLAHELGHCLAAWHMGGSADQILLWPLGGLIQVNVSHDPHSELVTAAGGMLMNVVICISVAPILIVQQCDFGNLFNPLLPPVSAEGLTWLNACEWTFWINMLLFAVNWLPALPMDMGRVVRALLWMQHEFRHGVILAARVAQITAVLLWIAAWFIHQHGHYSFATLPVVLVGMLLFFGAKQETNRVYESDTDDGLFGYDFSQGYTSLEKATQSRKAPPGPVKKWLDDRRTKRRERQQQLEAEEERRVDEVLARLHESGMHGLSEEDRELLNRVSARYRNRNR